MLYCGYRIQNLISPLNANLAGELDILASSRMEFAMFTAISIIFVLACGFFALLYAYRTSKSVFAADAGNDDMQRIASAIQEGAQAYLKRQYRTIAMVGVVVAILLLIFLT